MALNFGAASSQYLIGSAPSNLLGPPLTMACWHQMGDTSGTIKTLMALTDGVIGTRNAIAVNELGTVATFATIATSASFGAGSATGGSSVLGQWNHHGLIVSPTNFVTAYCNGVAGAGGSASLPPINSVTFGAPVSPNGSSTYAYTNGAIAEAAIWNDALSAADFASLATGVSPLLVRPDALVAYWPLLGYDSPASDRIGRKVLSPVNGPTVTAHPRIFYPKSKTARWMSKLPTKTQTLAANGVPQQASLTLYKATVNGQSVTANGVPQSASLGLSVIPFNATVPIITIGGVNHSSDVLYDSIRITQNVGEQPDSCIFTTVVNPSIVPTVGADVQVGLGNTSPSNLLFGGKILTVDQVYKGIQSNVAYEITCQDYTYLLNARRPFKAYVATAGNAVASDALTNFSSGLTSNIVSLPVVSITYDGNAEFSQCLTRLTTLVGAHWLVDPSKIVQIFTNSVPGAVPTTIDATNIAATNPNGARNLKIETDLSQLRNKIWVEGGGTLGGTAMVVSPGSVGATVPLTQAAGFYPSGYCVIYLPLVGTYPVVLQKFICSYSSVNQGLFVAAPASAPAFFNLQAGGNLRVGNYFYAQSYVTSAGETGLSNTTSLSIAGFPGGAMGSSIFNLTQPIDSSVSAINVYRSPSTGPSNLLYLAGSVSAPSPATPGSPAPWPVPIQFVDGVADNALGKSPALGVGVSCPQGALLEANTVSMIPGLNGIASLTGTLPVISVGTTVNVAGLVDMSAGSPYGVREYWLSDSSAITPALCVARAQAEYNLFGQPLITATYATRDANTRAGKTVTFNLGAPTNFAKGLLMMSVTITQFGVPNTFPLFTVNASSNKFNLQDWMRRLGGLLAINGVIVGAA